MNTLTILGAAIGLIAAGAASAQDARWAAGAGGAVFAATNDVTHNEVVMYTRTATGELKYVGNFDTGGRGQGGYNDPLQAQSSILLSPDHRYLLAVNAGSSTVSVFKVHGYGLELLDKTPTHGGNP